MFLHKSVQEFFVANAVYELLQHPLFGFLKDYDLWKLNHAIPAADSSAFGGAMQGGFAAVGRLIEPSSQQSVLHLRGGFRNDPERFAYLITDFQDECALHYVVFLNPDDDRAVRTFVAEYMAGDLILDFEVFFLLSKKGRNFFVLFVMMLACRS